MLSLCFGICLVLCVISLIVAYKVDDKCYDAGIWGKISYVFGGTFLVTVIFGVFSFVCILDNVNQLGEGRIIDNKIEMYEQENEEIERTINLAVQSYMDWEASTYANLKSKSAIDLVSMVPELKSDGLVQQQIQIYVENNEKIKELKEQRIDLGKCKWLLYFGS